jgi:serine protease AprX
MFPHTRQLDRARWGLLLLVAVAALLLATTPPQVAVAAQRQSALAKVAAATPDRQVTVIVQLRRGVDPETARQLVEAAGGEVVGELPIINGLVAKLPARKAKALVRHSGVRAVSLNAKTKPQTLVNFDPNKMATAYNQSAKSSNLWSNATGKGVGVAVIDTGIAGDQPSFRTSQTNGASRVVQSVVTNPNATTATDTYGHGTHVAGIIAGNDGYRPKSDPLFGKYAGAAPDANLVSIKAGDDDGDATVLDVIYGLQFAIDHKADYNIRVVNLSLESSDPQSYKTDPLDAAVEAAWFNGIVVVAAAGNRGTAGDAVKYAPGNDPYVITVGAVDDKNTKGVTDDLITSWSSRGTTQDGFSKPDLYAPGAHIVSTLAPNSAFASMCPSCVRDGAYIQAGGTSMAAPIISGIVADILEKRPTWTPNQVKGALLKTTRAITGGVEVDALNAYSASADKLVSNTSLTPNQYIDAASGNIDYTRSSWSRSSWSTAPSDLTAGWSRSSWSCTCSADASGTVDPTRSSWSRSSWSTDWSK